MNETLGTLHLEPADQWSEKMPQGAKMWRIAAQPHVVLRARRIFVAGRKVHRSGEGGYLLSDTTQLAHELRWFLQMFPLEMTRVARQYLEQRADEHVARQTLVQKIAAGSYKPPVGQRELAIPPRDYQSLAARMVLAGGSLLLADDVGLGKTCSAIATFVDPGVLPVLVVTLTHLPRQWEREVQRFAPWLRTYVIETATVHKFGSKKKHARRDNEAQEGIKGIDDVWPDVIIMSYSKLRTAWAPVLAEKVKMVVFDECQELRKSGSYKYDGAKMVVEHAAFRMGLSATPVYNFCDELHSIVEVLSPGVLGTRGEFMAEWGDGDTMVKEPEALGTYLRREGVMLRRTRRDVGRELPEMQRVPQMVDADLGEIDRVGKDVAELCKLLLGSGPEESKGQKMRAAEDISWKLRQATGLAKAVFVAEFVELLVASGERVVLYGWHREVYTIWEQRFAKSGIGCVFFTGQETPKQKDEARTKFMTDPSCRVMILSLRAGAGLDGLQQVCRTVVFGELDWSPGVHEQCIGRVYRDGQAEPVVAYFLVCDHGADPVMADMLELKEQQAVRMRDPDEPFIEKLEVDPHRVKRLAEDYMRQRRERGEA